MKITANVYKVKERRNAVVGYATITMTADVHDLPFVFVCKHIQIIENKDGDLFLGFPTRKDAKSEDGFDDIAFPANAETRKIITAIVLAEFRSL